MAKFGHGGNNKGMAPRMKVNKNVLPRLMKMLFKSYWWQLIIVGVSIVIAALGTSISGIFLKNVVSAIKAQDIDAFWGVIRTMILITSWRYRLRQCARL